MHADCRRRACDSVYTLREFYFLLCPRGCAGAGAMYFILYTGYCTPCTGWCWILDAAYWMVDKGCVMSYIVIPIPYTLYRMNSIVYCILFSYPLYLARYTWLFHVDPSQVILYTWTFTPYTWFSYFKAWLPLQTPQECKMSKAWRVKYDCLFRRRKRRMSTRCRRRYKVHSRQ